MNRRKWAMAAGLITAAGGAAAAFAQAPPAGGQSQSMLSIIWSGLEWPAYIIIAGSVAAISLIVEHFITIRRATITPAEQIKRARQLIEGRKFRECLDTVRKSSTFFATVMTAALQHARHGFDAMHEAAIEKSGQLSGRMFRKVEYLNIIGNLGPLMGLLGTVLGMIVAFAGIAKTGGGANASELSHGISLALVNTLLGLGLAVIGLGFFGVCRNRIDSLTVAATVDVLDLLEFFRPSSGSRSSESAATAEAARTTRPNVEQAAQT